MVGLDVLDERFVDPVPVFESCFEIAREEIDRSEKVIGVAVAGVKPQAMTEPRGRGLVALLLESYSREFDRKTLVIRGELMADQERIVCFVEAAELPERAAKVEVEIGVS